MEKLTRIFFIICLVLLSLLPYVAAQQNSSITVSVVYVGTPPNTHANYTEEYSVFATLNGKPLAQTNYNMSFSLSVTALAHPVSVASLQVNFLIFINKVSIEPNYNNLSYLHPKKPPVAPQTLYGTEYTGNFSVAPYFIISPNAPNQTLTNFEGTGTNISVFRVQAYHYSAGSINFNGPVIVMLTKYSLSGVLYNGKYVYDAKSGLLIYSINTTTYNFKVGSPAVPAQVNYTTQVWLTSTNLASINPLGDLQPITPTTVITFPSSTQFVLPYVFIAIVVVMVVVIALLLVFGRRR